MLQSDSWKAKKLSNPIIWNDVIFLSYIIVILVVNWRKKRKRNGNSRKLRLQYHPNSTGSYMRTANLVLGFYLAPTVDDDDRAFSFMFPADKQLMHACKQAGKTLCFRRNMTQNVIQSAKSYKLPINQFFHGRPEVSLRLRSTITVIRLDSNHIHFCLARITSRRH